MTLDMTFDTLRRSIARDRGMRDPDALSEQEQRDLKDIINQGVRSFYWHPPLPTPEGKPAARTHSWSFLEPTAELPIKNGTATYDLPADFGGLIDRIFTYPAALQLQPVAVVSETQLRAIQSRSTVAGPAKYAAIRVKAQAVNGPTRHEAVFYPTPTADTTVTFRMAVIPPELCESNQYPLGGAQHGETILQACLAAAEKYLDGEAGIHTQRFFESLSASIQHDKRLIESLAGDAWPLEHSEGGLKITRAYLRRLIGQLLEFGPNPLAWHHAESERVKLALQIGERKFYNPQPLPGEKYGWDWHFLRPTRPINTKSGQYAYDLPEDFAHFMGPLSHAPDSSVMYPPIEIVGEHQIRLRLQAGLTGRPRLAAVRTKPLDPSGKTQYEVLFWPIPDGAYTLSGQYRVSPDAVGEDSTLPHGGPMHANTIIEAVLAAAEEVNGKLGLHSVKYVECLVTSVGADRKLGAPKTLGYNRDHSDVPDMDHLGSCHGYDEHVCTYNGVAY